MGFIFQRQKFGVPIKTNIEKGLYLLLHKNNIQNEWDNFFFFHSWNIKTNPSSIKNSNFLVNI